MHTSKETMLLLMLLTAPTFSFGLTTSQQISIGSSLSAATPANSYWPSHSGQFAFGFHQHTSAAFSVAIWFRSIRQETLVWSANRDHPLLLGRDARLIFNGDGKLVVQDSQGAETAISLNSQPAAFALMHDSGNFVLYSSASAILWQSFDSPSDTLLPGQPLVAGKSIVSAVSDDDHRSGSRFQLVMMNDGNLVLFPLIDKTPSYLAYWDSQTSKSGGHVSLHLSVDGQLSLINSTGVNIKNITGVGAVSQTGTNATVYRLTLDADGILRLYASRNSEWDVKWVSPANKCDPIGLCGVNSYCSLNVQEAQCLCLPGFDFIDQSRKSSGCGRNSTFDACNAKDHESSLVSFTELDGFQWEDDSYSTVSTNSKAECEEECFRDCNCQVVLFMNRQCKKQKFPLRFPKTARESPVTTIVKVLQTRSKELKKSRRKDMFMVGLACISISALVVLLLLILIVCRRCHLCWSYKTITTESNDEALVMDLDTFNLRSFTFEELSLATNGFVNKLGRGSFGTVFKGVLQNGQRAIAVKRLERIAGEGEVEFRNEMKSIGRTHHRNLLRLLGYCDQGTNRLLVYDYMSNGSLSKFLFNSGTMKPSWDVRVNITIGIARGILYLHEECESQIIHCDINPNNILIDDNHCAKIADFGLAKLLMPDQTRTETGIRGTRGFICPEWHKSMPITAKADVYSFGIVLLVVICCRRSVDVNVPEREAILVEWVYECFKSNRVRSVVRDEEGVDEQELEKMIKIGLWCVQEEAAVRPAMKKVVAMIEGTIDIPVPPSLTSDN